MGGVVVKIPTGAEPYTPVLLTPNPPLTVPTVSAVIELDWALFRMALVVSSTAFPVESAPATTPAELLARIEPSEDAPPAARAPMAR
jgi:hypothetical protein